jgi:hypothetical protein
MVPQGDGKCDSLEMICRNHIQIAVQFLVEILTVFYSASIETQLFRYQTGHVHIFS